MRSSSAWCWVADVRRCRVAVIGLLAAVAVAAPVQAGADDITGLWLVDDGEAQVRIEPCGDAFCGRLVWLQDPLDELGRQRRDDQNRDPQRRRRALLGLRILERVSARADAGAWKDGRIYDPKNGKTYRCKLELEPDGRLKLRGYVGFSLFGRTTRWTCVPEDRGAGAMPQHTRAVWIDADASVAPGGHELDDGLALV